MTKERIQYLLKGAEQEMIHGDYVPNIPEREALCRLALAAFDYREALKDAKMHFEAMVVSTERNGAPSAAELIKYCEKCNAECVEVLAKHAGGTK